MRPCWLPAVRLSPTTGTNQPRAPLATLRVPEDYPTIQAAVNAASAGDLISIGPSPNADGAYHESVTVKTPDITLRGRDRNRVILDGQYRLDDGFEVVANNVVIENMTARHYTGNGFYWTGVTGYRGSCLLLLWQITHSTRAPLRHCHRRAGDLPGHGRAAVVLRLLIPHKKQGREMRPC